MPPSTSHKRKRLVSDGSSFDDDEKELEYRSIMGTANNMSTPTVITARQLTVQSFQGWPHQKKVNGAPPCR